MNTPSLLILCLATAAHAAEPVITRDPQPVTKGTESWTVESPFLPGANKIEVLLPSPMDKGRAYPVIYVLPVNAGTKGDWGHPLEEALRDDLANRHQAIFVVPSFPVLPWFGDSATDPSMRQNRHVSEVVVPFIDKTYPTLAKPEGRALIGFSKSALGALQLFLLEPDKFGAAAVFENWYGVPDDLQWNKWGFAECYGTRANYDAMDPQKLLNANKDRLISEKRPLAVLIGGPGPRLGTELLLMQLRGTGIPHVEVRDTSWGHTWTSGWLPFAVTAVRSR